jgi:hypothetical protein
VGVVVPVPERARLAGRVLELVEAVKEVAVAAGPGPVLPGADERLYPVDGEGPQPGAERARPVVVLEERQLAEDDDQDVLGQVLGVAVAQPAAGDPADDPGPVDGDEPPPHPVVGGGAESVQ